MGFSTFDVFKRLEAEDAVPVDGEELKALQHCLLVILDDVASVCRDENIVWTLGGGSVLGAVRHRGFIPWDDDLDINMPRGEWKRFRAGFLKRFREKYVVYEPGSPKNYPLAFPRIRLKGTHVVTREDLLLPDIVPGAFIDVFMLESTYDSTILRRLHGVGSLLLGFCYSCRKHFHERKFLKRWGLGSAAFRMKRLIGCCLGFLPIGVWTRLWDMWNRQCGDIHSKYVTFPVGRRHFFGELALRAGLAEVRDGTFEGRAVPVPKDAEAYMRRLYGPNFMTPPPPEKREKHVVFRPFDLGDFGKEVSQCRR